MYKLEDKVYPCDTSLTMRFIGGKWKSVILIHLLDGTKRYNEIRKLIPTITERTLSLQLKQLEDDKLIIREVYTDKPPLKVEYKLTEFGKTLEPVLKSIADWGGVAAAIMENIELVEKGEKNNAKA
ncbi:winged helix-turn-helix transcriptional regulator [Sediminitomix flava]|uniref:HxlR family transcriptional regulator n=1 Tax=Sediminitomix flava TaxID=379075 RepID=A0A315ZBZ2_SEDFL|nr:winged helix-turn-helix transcriptional regulator [Sediminitomix flava]PWJ43085.1 HxlR family transcriptional regulator [Sediminitomix flava]